MKQYKHLSEVRTAFAQRRAAIRRRLKEFALVPKEQYFYELLYCVMTPQSSAVNAAKAQRVFETRRFRTNDFDPEPVLFDKRHYIRFHRTKSRWIIRVKEEYDAIEQMIVSGARAEEKREWLVRNVMGLSYKEATHFLRNIGKNGGLTILDRHILKNLRRHGVIRTIPPSLTKQHYLRIEKKFLRFAGETGITTDELDLLFWSSETGEILK